MRRMFGIQQTSLLKRLECFGGYGLIWEKECRLRDLNYASVFKENEACKEQIKAKNAAKAAKKESEVLIYASKEDEKD